MEIISIIASLAIFLGGIIWFFIRRKHFSKPHPKSFTPGVHVSELKKTGIVYAEIHNVGNDPIKDLKITANHLQNGNRVQKSIYRFFNANEDPGTGSAHNCEFLKVKEKKVMASLPQWSDDGEILFTVEGVGVNSKKPIKETFTINNQKKYIS